MTLRTYCLRGDEVLNVPGKIIFSKLITLDLRQCSSYCSGMPVNFFLLCRQADQLEGYNFCLNKTGVKLGFRAIRGI